MQQRKDRTFLVIGAGIGGVAAALSLARRGHHVDVVEQAAEIGEIGAGIQLAPNALRALDNLGLLDAVYRAAFVPLGATMRDAVTAKVITRLDFGDGFRSTYGYTYVVTHRSDLHAALVAMARDTGLVDIRTGAEVTQLEQVGVDRVEVTLASGERCAAGAVIGADGLHSAARRHVVGDDELVYAGDFAYRGTVGYDQIAERDDRDDVTWWVGPGMHLIQYPIRRGELFNQVAVFSSDQDELDPESWGTTEELDRHFTDKHDLVRQGAALVGRDRRWAMVDREPAPTWTRGRVTLLGDAAHPMLQYLAQGGCMALEDAVCLGACVEREPDVDAAFARYERLRLPRTTKVQRWARNMGEIVHAAGVPAVLRDEMFRLRPTVDFEQVAWLYGYDASRVDG